MKSHALVPRGLVIGLGLFALVILVGVVGFLIEGLSLVDALYTTVSAVTTVGYAPGRVLSPTAKVFVTALILAGVGTGIYVLGSLTEYLIEGGLRGTVHRRGLWRRMEQLQDHYVIAGFGRVGQRVAARLDEAGVKFVVVDNNPAVLPIARDRGYLYLEADATGDKDLISAGVTRARCLLACADSDVKNVYITLSARALSPKLFIVARASDADAERNLYNAGASRVVSPYTMAGNRMAHLAVQPLAADFVDVFVRGHAVGVQVEEVGVDSQSPLAGRRVGDIRAKELAGGQVLAVERGGRLITFVSDDLVVSADDRVLVAGTEAQINNFNASTAGSEGETVSAAESTMQP